MAQSNSSLSNQHTLPAAFLYTTDADPKQTFKKNNSSKSKNIFKIDELYGFCQKLDDGEMYRYLEGCSSWLHTKCAFDNNGLALGLYI